MAINFAKSAVPAPMVKKPIVQIELAAVAPEKPKHAGGRPLTGNAKVVLNIRVDSDVLARWKATGAGWQARMNEALKQAKL